MSYYHRRLPHWQPDGAAIFLTWRLFGSLPADPRNNSDVKAGQAFVLTDRSLDRAEFGPRWLSDDRIAREIIEAFHFGQYQLGFYELYSFAIMPNHVHLLFQPHVPLARITKSLKGYTARRANLVLQRTGSPFWQYESFDHWVRNERELRKIVDYIEYNPVAAGLVGKPEEWRWSSAYKVVELQA
jgi:REP element-mobilizing transposase RayT